MAGAVPTLYWFDRWDERIGLLRVVGELVHTEELNGEDTLEFQSYEVPAKGDRLLWLDGGVWREHVVVRTDEPVAGLDPKVTSEMYELIETLNRDGITIIMISHDIAAAVRYASHILHIGATVFYGTKEEYLESDVGKFFLLQQKTGKDPTDLNAAQTETVRRGGV